MIIPCGLSIVGSVGRVEWESGKVQSGKVGE
jgi:hypothetical protein